MNWCNDLLIECYDSIYYQDQLDDQLLSSIKQGLATILVYPGKNDTVKNQLIENKGPVTFSNGDKFNLNQQFIESTILLSNELELNELATAEILYNANKTTLQGIEFMDNGKQYFFKRVEYILNILGYLIVNKKLDLIITDFEKFGDNLVESFNKLYKILNNLNDLINKLNVTNNLNEILINSIIYSKREIFQCHELLGQIYFNLIENYFDKFNLGFFNKVVNHLKSQINDDDLLIIHYLPGLFSFINKLDHLAESQVISLHKQIKDELNNDFKLISIDNDTIDLTNSKLKNFEILFYFMTLTNLINWCKSTKNYEQFNFHDDFLKYLQICLNYGVLENLLRLTSETATTETIKNFEINGLCDFKFNLQKNFPNLQLPKFKPNQDILNQLHQSNNQLLKLVNTDDFKISKTIIDDLLPTYWHHFFRNFINNVAIILTQLRDNEEDFLLSSINKQKLKDKEIQVQEKNNKDLTIGFNNDENDKIISTTSSNDMSNNSDIDNFELDFEEIYSRADLERFYLSFVYAYNYRPLLCQKIWNNDENVIDDSEISNTNNDLIGFIMWGVNNNSSPLITATFCLLLSSLTSSGDSASIKIFELLLNNNSLKKIDYSKISIDSITESLTYYLNSLNDNFENDLNNQIKQSLINRSNFIFSNKNLKQFNEILIELSNDSMIFINGFLNLISSIILNLNDNFERSREIKNNLYHRFKPIIVGFLRFDNIIVNSKLGNRNLSNNNGSSNDNLPNNTKSNTNNNNANNNNNNSNPIILMKDSNRIQLINLIFHYLKSFNDLTSKLDIWKILDSWMFHNLIDKERSTNNKLTFIKYNITIKNAFKINLVDLTNILNFIELIKHLTIDNSTRVDFMNVEQYTLFFPEDLGLGYRLNNEIGVWPYFEFIILDVFRNSIKVNDMDIKIMLQKNLITIFQSSIDQIDWEFLINFLPNLLDFDYNLLIKSNHESNLSFDNFIQLHQSISILNYLYDEKSITTLFNIIELEQDEELVEHSLQLLIKLLDLQDVYKHLISKINPDTNTATTTTPTGNNSLVLKNSNPIYYPKNFNYNVNLFELINYNISIIIKFGLLIDSNNENIIESSINLLDKLNNTYKLEINNNNYLNKNKLFTIYTNSNESLNLKYSIINKFLNCNSIGVKFKILKFLNNDLTKFSNNACISHFILGYKIQGSYLTLDSHQESFLKSLIELLILSLDLISTTDYNSGINIINYNSVKISSLILSIIIKLCEFPFSSIITLNFIKDGNFNLFEKLINIQSKIDLQTIWYDEKFNANLLTGTINNFLNSKESIKTFFEFFNYRILVLKFLTLEFHNLSQSKSIFLKNQYLKVLLNEENFLNSNYKVLSFLDLLNFKFKNFEKFNFQKYHSKVNINLILNNLIVEGEKNDEFYNDEIFEKLKVLKLDNNHELSEIHELSSYIKNFITYENLKKYQLNYLHNWVQLIEVIINDGNLSKTDYQNFILEILSNILPKINEFFETDDIIFSEELISLCVLLFNNYFETDDEEILIERLLILLSTSIKGIISLNSTIKLRNDLYVLINNFVIKILSINKSNLLSKVKEIFKKIDVSFFEILINDIIINEGSIKIISIILLENLIHLFNKFNDNYLIDKLIKNNSILLIIRLIKRIDEILEIENDDISEDNNDNNNSNKLVPDNEIEITNNKYNNLSNILYELTIFKSILNLLIRIGTIRQGSSYLIQSELFSIIKNCKILIIDPDLSLNFKFDKINQLNRIDRNTSNELINYYEILIPIFKLISILLISMGPFYKPSKIQGKDLLSHFNKLKNNLVKKDILINEGKLKVNDFEFKNLNELIDQFILLDSLVNS